MLETNEERKIRIKQSLISIVPLGFVIIVIVYILFNVHRVHR
jgi:hypothetical protein